MRVSGSGLGISQKRLGRFGGLSTLETAPKLYVEPTETHHFERFCPTHYLQLSSDERSNLANCCERIMCPEGHDCAAESAGGVYWLLVDIDTGRIAGAVYAESVKWAAWMEEAYEPDESILENRRHPIRKSDPAAEKHSYIAKCAYRYRKQGYGRERARELAELCWAERPGSGNGALIKNALKGNARKHNAA